MSKEGFCKVCGGIFVPHKMAHGQVYCSKKCKKKAYYYSPNGQIQRKRALKRVMYLYHTDKEFNKRWKERTNKYVTSPKGRIHKSNYRKKYRKTENGISSDIKYRNSNKRKVSLKKYTQSEKGKANGTRAFLKRIERLSKIFHQFTQREWLQKRRDTFGVCFGCDTYVGVRKLTLDHIIPISKAEEGQVYTIDDIQPLCLSCNTSKNDRVI